ncbi:hypothetical protein PsYK624_129420 [Phanerochaete sordida]|uniref:Uncharacterized protein n=1 Tax=Phanerochaete sordida TaxID=48140 RepID=A0A9P3GL42_9APHY|nr:hypothetical protein PsYK624_129420 [Phanerochaete sordida]
MLHDTFFHYPLPSLPSCRPSVGWSGLATHAPWTCVCFASSGWSSSCAYTRRRRSGISCRARKSERSAGRRQRRCRGVRCPGCSLRARSCRARRSHLVYDAVCLSVAAPCLLQGASSSVQYTYAYGAAAGDGYDPRV